MKRAPLTSGDCLDLEMLQYNDGTRPAAEVIYDNLELWTSLVPSDALRGREQHQPHAALHQLAHCGDQHPGRRGRGAGGRRDRGDQRHLRHRRARGGNKRSGQPRGGGQAAHGVERQRPGVHDHPGLPSARHHQRRRRDPVRVSHQRRQPVRVHLDQRGDARRRGILVGPRRRRAVV